ncbi:MAG: hypothetical protein D6814_06935 [Calditrichaeota bacterium]|nr:MAG: hypothetical protein D6814_06935 [Calditrichota bacterium]
MCVAPVKFRLLLLEFHNNLLPITNSLFPEEKQFAIENAGKISPQLVSTPCANRVVFKPDLVNGMPHEV